ncbi:MAG: hypothetical protein WBP74_09035, partial [Nitrososphaeraceae archaeon]
ASSRNFVNRIEDGIQLFKYSRDICYYHVLTIIIFYVKCNCYELTPKGKSQLTQMQRNLIFWAHYHQDYFL